jgi:hypothetical protein
MVMGEGRDYGIRFTGWRRRLRIWLEAGRSGGADVHCGKREKEEEKIGDFAMLGRFFC